MTLKFFTKYQRAAIWLLFKILSTMSWGRANLKSFHGISRFRLRGITLLITLVEHGLVLFRSHRSRT